MFNETTSYLSGEYYGYCKVRATRYKLLPPFDNDLLPARL